jgi:hypothetical protein
MANPQKTSLIINPAAFSGQFSVVSPTDLKPGDTYTQNGVQLGTVIRNTGLVGSMWGVDIYVSNVVPKVKRKYTKILGQYITYRSMKYQIIHRNGNIYTGNCGFNSRVPMEKDFSYYQIKKLL